MFWLRAPLLAAFLWVLFPLLFASCSSRGPGRDAKRSVHEKSYYSQKRLRFMWPLRYQRVSSYYGWRPGGRIHEGIDLRAGRNESVKASEAGRVIHRSWIRGYGRTIIIDHGGGWSSLYAHLQTYAVALGQRVSKGQSIGGVGSSGRSTGTHLHFELRKGADPLDPLLFLPKPNRRGRR